MKKQKGNFTIEAAILIPFLLCMMMGVLQEGIHLYEKCEKKESSEKVRDWDGVSRFYELWIVKELEEEWSNEQE